MKKIYLLSIAMLWTIVVLAQSESNFYTPQTGGITRNLRNDYNVDNNFSTDDSQKMQQAINDVSAAGGGRIIIPAGSYSFAKVDMKSNVRLEIDKNAVIRPAPVASGNYWIFNMGKSSSTTIRNVSIKGIGGWFTVDLRFVSNDRVFVFIGSRVDNFELANFKIKDNNTLFQSVGLGHYTHNGVHYVPRNGVVKNADANNTHYGYGLVQIQAGDNILFKNLSGTGGVTLRLETGWEVMNRIQPASKTPKLNAIYGRQIECTSGQAAVMVSPHTIDQGFFDIRDVDGISCEFAVKLDKGHVDEVRYADINLTPGSFSNNSILSDVKGTYGTTAEVRGIFLRFIPCSARGTIGTRNAFENFYPAAACAPIGNFAAGLWRGRGPNSPGSYSVKISNVQSSGYANSVPNIVNGDNCDYESCQAVNGFSPWIPKESRGSSGQCGGSETGGTSGGSSGGGTSGGSSSGGTSGGSSGTDWNLFTVKGSRYITPQNNGGGNGVKIVKTSGNNGNHKKWQLVGSGDYKEIKNVATGKCIGIFSGSVSNGGKAVQWTCTGSQDQQWKQLSRGNNEYSFENKKSGKCLDVTGNGGENIQLHQWTCNASNVNQRFKFVNPPAARVASGDLEEASTSQSVAAYPNPTEGLLNLNGLTDGEQFILVTNSMGQKVLGQSVNVQGGATTLDLTSLEAGIYILSVENNLKMIRIIVE